MEEALYLSGHQRENQLLVELSQNLEGGNRPASDHELSAEPLNWDYILTVASRNAIFPRVGRNLLTHFSDVLPADVTAFLSRQLHEHLQRNMYLTRKLLDIVRLFEAHNIPILPFKGPILAAEAYGDLSARQYVDLDVLVHPEHLEQAIGLLQSDGYSPLTSIGWMKKSGWHLTDKKDIYFRSADELVNVELHWKLSGAHFALPFEMNGLWARLENVTVAGLNVKTLPFDDLLIYLCLHGSRHGWERFGWICDVNELVSSHPTVNLDKVVEKARELGCENVLCLGLYLIHDFFGREFRIRDWAKVEKDLMFLTTAKRIRAQLFSEKVTVMGLGDRYAYHLKLKEDRRDKWKLHYHYIFRYLRVIFTPRAVDADAFSLPRVLEPLYYLMRPLRLFYTYALRSNKRGT